MYNSASLCQFWVDLVVNLKFSELENILTSCNLLGVPYKSTPL